MTSTIRSLIALIVILLALPGVAIAQEGASEAPPSAGASVRGPVTGYAPVNGLEMYMFTGSGLPESYAAVAPDPDGWSELVEKVKQLERDFTAIAPEAIEAISAPMLIVIGDSDAIRPEHAIELFRLLGGGVSGDNVGMPERAQLAVLPGLSHVGVAMAVPTWLVPTITPFLDAPMPDGG